MTLFELTFVFQNFASKYRNYLIVNHLQKYFSCLIARLMKCRL